MQEEQAMGNVHNRLATEGDRAVATSKSEKRAFQLALSFLGDENVERRSGFRRHRLFDRGKRRSLRGGDRR